MLRVHFLEVKVGAGLRLASSAVCQDVGAGAAVQSGSVGGCLGVSGSCSEGL